MKLLVSYGADPNIPTMKPAGRPFTGEGIRQVQDMSGVPPIPYGGPAVLPLHAASGVGYGEGFAANSHRYAPTGFLPAIKYLVEELGADVNAVDHEGNTPVHLAASRGDNESILFLVSKGADVTRVNREGNTTVDMANGPVQRTQPYPETHQAAREARRQEQPPMRHMLKTTLEAPCWSRLIGRRSRDGPSASAREAAGGHRGRAGRRPAAGACAPPSPPPRHPPAATTMLPAEQTALVKQYCATLPQRSRQGRADVAGQRSTRPSSRSTAKLAEKMIRKLRAGMMPPPGARRPEPAVLTALASAVRGADGSAAALKPNPGSRPFQRLNRAEYAAAVQRPAERRRRRHRRTCRPTRSATASTTSPTRRRSRRR